MLNPSSSVLHLAPERNIERFVQSRGPARYIQCDLNPIYDLATDITDLSFSADAFDLVLCSHVLEHVPDDAAAIRELSRITHPEGVALIQVPWHPTGPTDEDYAADVDERIKRFGQADHVRQYGHDFVVRLERSGGSVRIIRESDFAETRNLKLAPNEAVFILHPHL